MSDHDRSRPRRTVTLDPVIDAYLGDDVVNAGRLIDHLVSSNVSTEKLATVARREGITADETEIVGLNLPEPEEDDS